MWIERLLRVPPSPAPPAGSAASVRRFRPARGFYRYRLLSWGLSQVGAAVGLFVGLSAVDFAPDFTPDRVLHGLELFGIAGFLLQLPFTFLLVKVDYENRWYVVTDRSLRIREGVVRVREQTMSFANIQNLSIRQGPLQRLFGIADLRVRTAGGGGSEEAQHDLNEGLKNLHLGYFRGVDRPRQIRDTILERLKRHRDAGLGDPDEAGALLDGGSASGPSAASPALAAARDLLAEARGLRRALAPRSADPLDSSGSP